MNRKAQVCIRALLKPDLFARFIFSNFLNCIATVRVSSSFVNICYHLLPLFVITLIEICTGYFLSTFWKVVSFVFRFFFLRIICVTNNLTSSCLSFMSNEAVFRIYLVMCGITINRCKIISVMFHPFFVETCN